MGVIEVGVILLRKRVGFIEQSTYEMMSYPLLLGCISTGYVHALPLQATKLKMEPEGFLIFVQYTMQVRQNSRAKYKS